MFPLLRRRVWHQCRELVERALVLDKGLALHLLDGASQANRPLIPRRQHRISQRLDPAFDDAHDLRRQKLARRCVLLKLVNFVVDGLDKRLSPFRGGVPHLVASCEVEVAINRLDVRSVGCFRNRGNFTRQHFQRVVA